MNELVSRVVGRPWPKGVSGNTSGLPGRPAGSRQTFSAGFLDDLAKTWRDKGRQTMEWTAENQPGPVPHTSSLPVEVLQNHRGPPVWSSTLRRCGMAVSLL